MTTDAATDAPAIQHAVGHRIVFSDGVQWTLPLFVTVAPRTTGYQFDLDCGDTVRRGFLAPAGAPRHGLETNLGHLLASYWKVRHSAQETTRECLQWRDEQMARITGKHSS